MRPAHLMVAEAQRWAAVAKAAKIKINIGGSWISGVKW